MKSTSPYVRIRAGVTLIGGLLLVPFSINNFLQGRTLLGVTSGLLALAAMFSSWQYTRHGKLLTRGYDVLVLAMLACIVSIYEQGEVGMLWAFPLVLLANMLLPRNPALWLTGAFIAVATAIGGFTTEWALAARFAATSSLVAAFAAIFVWQIKQQQGILDSAIRFDPLTGVFNRRELETWYGRVAHLAPSTMLINVDKFRLVNDEFGHAVGDQLLIDLVEELNAHLGLHDELFRVGADEFVAVLPKEDGPQAARLAHRLRNAVARKLDGKATISIGLAEGLPEESLAQLLKRCERAIKRAKARGGNNVQMAGGVDWGELRVVC